MAEISLRNKQGAIVAYSIIDDEISGEIDKYTWHLDSNGYVRTFIRCGDKKKLVTLHGLVLGRASHGMVIDHINGVRHDNRKINLRFATIQENSWNRRKKKGGDSKTWGVTRSGKRWRVRFQVGGKRISCGAYSTYLEAKTVAEKVSREIHGRFSPECPDWKV